MTREELTAFGLEGEALEAVLALHEKDVETHKGEGQAWQSRHAQDTAALRTQLAAVQNVKALEQALEGLQFSSRSAKAAFISAWEAAAAKEKQAVTDAPQEDSGHKAAQAPMEGQGDAQAQVLAQAQAAELPQAMALNEGEENAEQKEQNGAAPAQSLLGFEAFVAQYRAQDPDAFVPPAQTLPMLVQPAQQPSAFDLAGSALRRAFGLGL